MTLAASRGEPPTATSAGPTFVDLSQEIYEGMVVYTGHLETRIWQAASHEETAKSFEGGFSFASMGIQLCDHGPTHVDALAHLDPRPSAPTIDAMALDLFYGSGVCLDVSAAAPQTYISAADLERAAARSREPVRPGGVLLLYTGTHERVGGTSDYRTQYPGLDESASRWIADHRIKIFGVDSPSPDNPTSRSYPCHMMCREHGITHYENLAQLDKLLDRPFTFIGFPLRIRQGTGSPVRAVALLDGDSRPVAEETFTR